MFNIVDMKCSFIEIFTNDTLRMKEKYDKCRSCCMHIYLFDIVVCTFKTVQSNQCKDL